MKALITGISGFVGGYLKKELEEHGHTVLGMDIVGNGDVHCADLTDYASAKQVLASVAPDCIFHLAGQASVARSWDAPQATFDSNVNGTLNLLEAVRALPKRADMLIVGSSDEYGKVRENDCPIQETLVAHPCNPYAVSKLAQEQLCKLYAEAYGMRIVMTRSFNHTGPGQKKGFVIPDFCSRIAQMERDHTHVLKVGNLDARRDFSDVRDVVRAYRLLMEKGKAGEVYNVGSGTSYRIRELLDMLVELSGEEIDVRIDPDKIRPIELPLIQGDIKKLIADTGYQSHVDIQSTMRDTLAFWRTDKENI